MRTVPDSIRPEFYKSYGKPLQIYELYLVSPYVTPDYYFVANNKDITFGDQVYTALGIKRSPIRSEDGTVINEVELGLDNVDLEFRSLVVSGQFYKKRCTIKLVFANLLQFSNRYMILYDGFLDQPKGDSNWVTMTLRSFSIFDRDYPKRIFQIGCNSTFCDDACTLNLSNFTKQRTTNSNATKSRLEFTSSLGEVDDYFSPGYAEILTGDLAGQVRPIFDSGDNYVQLRVPFDGIITDDIDVKVVRLCQKDIDACQYHNNYINYQGFPHVPKKPTF